MAAAAAGLTPLHEAKKPIMTVIAVGPPVRTGGSGWETGSVILAAGGISFS
jgi:hypothetical protein